MHAYDRFGNIFSNCQNLYECKSRQLLQITGLLIEQLTLFTVV